MGNADLTKFLRNRKAKCINILQDGEKYKEFIDNWDI